MQQWSCDIFGDIQHRSSIYGNWLHKVSQASQGDMGRMEFPSFGGMGTIPEACYSWYGYDPLIVVGFRDHSLPCWCSWGGGASSKRRVVSTNGHNIYGMIL